MLRLLLFPLLTALPCTSASAATWQLASAAVDDRGRMAFYVDTATLRIKGDTVRFRSEQVFETERDGFNRILLTATADCRSNRLTVLRQSFYKDQIVVGFSSTPQEITANNLDSGTSWLTRRVCTGSYLNASATSLAISKEQIFRTEWLPFAGRLMVQVAPGRSQETRVASRTDSSTPSLATSSP